jgi:hypothetical protein
MTSQPAATIGRVVTAMAPRSPPTGALDLEGAGRLATHLVDHGTDTVLVNGTPASRPTLHGEDPGSCSRRPRGGRRPRHRDDGHRVQRHREDRGADRPRQRGGAPTPCSSSPRTTTGRTSAGSRSTSGPPRRPPTCRCALRHPVADRPGASRSRRSPSSPRSRTSSGSRTRPATRQGRRRALATAARPAGSPLVGRRRGQPAAARRRRGRRGLGRAHLVGPELAEMVGSSRPTRPGPRAAPALPAAAPGPVRRAVAGAAQGRPQRARPARRPGPPRSPTPTPRPCRGWPSPPTPHRGGTRPPTSSRSRTT